MSCLYRITSLLGLGLAVVFSAINSASASPIVANGSTYPAWTRVVATVQAAPQSQQAAGVTVTDPYHVTVATAGTTVKMQTVYYVNVDKPVLTGGTAYTITANAYTASTVVMATTEWGVLNIPTSGNALTGALANPFVDTSVANGANTQQGAAKDSNADGVIDIGPQLGQRTQDNQDPETPASFADWMKFQSVHDTIFSGGLGALAATTTGGVAQLGTATEGGAGNLTFVAGTFNWVGGSGAPGSSTKVYYNPYSPYDQTASVTNSGVRSNVTFRFIDTGGSSASVGLDPYNVASGSPGGTVAGAIAPFHNVGDLYIDPSFTPSNVFGTYYNDSAAHGYGANGAISSLNTQFFGIDSLSFGGGVQITIPNVPEPSSIVLCGLGCVALVGLVRRRQG